MFRYCVCKRLSMSNYDKKSSKKVRLTLIWEELVRLYGHLTTFIREGQKGYCMYVVILLHEKLMCG